MKIRIFDEARDSFLEIFTYRKWKDTIYSDYWSLCQFFAGGMVVLRFFECLTSYGVSLESVYYVSSWCFFLLLTPCRREVISEIVTRNFLLSFSCYHLTTKIGENFSEKNLWMFWWFIKAVLKSKLTSFRHISQHTFYRKDIKFVGTPIFTIKNL